MLRRLVILAALLLACAPLSAQQTLAPGSHRFAGVWTGNGSTFAFTAEFTVGRDAAVSGAFLWTLLESGDGSKEGVLQQGTEWVEGSLQPGGRMMLRGMRLDRPDLISLDEYELVISPTGALSGRSLGGEESGGGRLAGLRL